MRFLYYDRIVRIEPGRRIVGVKAFALSEEFLRGHFSREPLVPAPILLEAMAQVLGWGIIMPTSFASRRSSPWRRVFGWNDPGCARA